MNKDFKISGFDEAVIIVRDEKPHLDCWVENGAWEIKHKGEVDSNLLAAWGIPEGTGKDWLLGHPECDTGFVRLIKLYNVGVQKDIRADDQPCDTGGIYDLNVRVPNMEKIAPRMRALQWHATSSPISWDFGSLGVKEWVVRGPDNVRLAIIERVYPPLQGYDHMREFSQVFNSTQVVKDFDKALEFYRDILGFKILKSYESESFPPGPNLMGIPQGVSSQIGMKLHVLHPDGLMQGSVEILANPRAQGFDLSADAGPPNFGMAALRFPVEGIEALLEHLQQANYEIASPLAIIELLPYGNIKTFAINSPEGARLEFLEKLS